ncbi:MAG: DUF4377 domain-containing protein, partial [Robiginitalea sp.]
LIVFSCNTNKNKEMESVTYWVNSYRVPCTGVAPMECLQVRKEGSDQWQFFYSNIIGFDYEPGYLYRIRVKEEALDPAEVPADASSIKYTLVSVEEKVGDPKLRINDIWVLSKLDGRQPQDEELTDLKRPYIEFHLRDGRYMGTDGCNTFRGTIKSIGDRELLLGPAMGTKMSCVDMSLPNAFLSLLSRCDSFQIDHGVLRLLEGNTELLEFQKTD